jgi:type IV/VI secretion system ImpK/VasF family protein
VVVRARVRDELKRFRQALGAVFSSVEAFEILFPLVVHCDELLRTAAGARAHRWEPLQSEMFEVEDGGEQFFVRLRMLLESEDVHPFAYEVYYFCLSDYFGGRWRGNESRLGEFKRLLRERIRPPHPAPPPERELEAVDIRAAGFPWTYYLAAAAFLGLVLIVLLVASHLLVTSAGA